MVTIPVVGSMLPATQPAPVPIQQPYTQDVLTTPLVCSTKSIPSIEPSIELKFEVEKKPKQNKEKVMKAIKKSSAIELFRSLVLSLSLVAALSFEVPEAYFMN